MEKIITILLTLSLFLILGTNSNSQTLYGAAYIGPDGPSTLYTIDTNTGQTTAIGPIGFERCNAMGFDITDTLFALCERADGSDEPVLVNIDPAKGIGNEVGPTEFCDIWTDLSFRNSDNVLFAHGFDGCPNFSIASISTVTGAAMNIAQISGISECCGGALVFSETNTLFYLGSSSSGPDSNLYMINQTTGDANLITAINFPPLVETNPRINAMDFNPLTSVLFVSVVIGGPSNPGERENFIGTVNITSGDLTILGPTIEGMDAIAFSSAPPQPPVQVPTISGWGLIATAAILGIVGFMVIRRRKVNV